MRILIATDAWHPQVNGVVRTLTSLACSAGALGVEVRFLGARQHQSRVELVEGEGAEDGDRSDDENQKGRIHDDER